MAITSLLILLTLSHSMSSFLDTSLSAQDLLVGLAETDLGYEGVVSETGPCCTNKPLVSPDYSGVEFIQTPENYTGCRVVTELSRPFLWVSDSSDPFDFLLLDLRVPHEIQALELVALDGYMDWAPPNDATIAFSTDGVTWDDAEMQGCTWEGSQLARMVRLHATDSRPHFALALVPYGRPLETYDPMATTDSSEGTVCAGFQAWANLNLVSISQRDGCAVDVEVTLDGEPVYPESASASRDIGPAIAVQVRSMHGYDMCSVQLEVNSFQEEFQGTYLVRLTESAGQSFQQQFVFQTAQDGEQLPNFYIEMQTLTAVTPEDPEAAPPYNFVTVAPFSGTVTGEAAMAACAETAFQGAPIAPDTLKHFQLNGVNEFAQTLMRQFEGLTGYGRPSGVYVTLIYDLYPQCVTVHPLTGILVEAECDGASGVICVVEEGEMSEIQLVPTECQPLTGDQEGVTLNFRLSLSIVGSRVRREVTCYSNNPLGDMIEGSEVKFELLNGESAAYSVTSSTEGAVSEVSCSAYRKASSVIGSLTATVLIPAQPVNLTLLHDTPRSTAEFVRYLTHDQYGSDASFRAAVSGYPAPDVSYSFMPKYGLLREDLEEELQVTNTFSCEIVENNVTITVQSDIVKTIPHISPADTGRYALKVSNANSEDVKFLELIHPFSIWCDNVCQTDLSLGDSYSARCVINHHLLASEFEFLEGGSHPLEIKFDRDTFSQDLSQFLEPQMSGCEFNVPVQKALTAESNPFINWEPDLRKVTINFQLYSVQEWNRGSIKLSVTASELADCYYQQGCDAPVPSGECVSETSAGSIQLAIDPLQQVSIPEYVPGQSCSRNTRTVHLAGDDRIGLDSVFMKMCYLPSRSADPEVVCETDGSRIASVESDSLPSVIYSRILSGSTNLTLGRYSLKNVWNSMSCNANLLDHPDATETIFSVKSPDEGVFLTWTFRNGMFFRKDMLAADDKLGVLCILEPGKIKSMFQSDYCQHKSLDPAVGLSRHVNIDCFGAESVHVLCMAVPEGSYANLTFNANVQRGFDYIVPYPEALEVTGFKCFQIFPEIQPDVAAIAPEKEQVFQLTISNREVPLTVDRRVTSTDLWCRFGDSNLQQPCFGRDVTVSACAVGNPVLRCDWKKKLQDDSSEQILTNDMEGIEISLDQPERCNATEICSSLTIHNLNIQQHSGSYAFSCSTGLEEDLPKTHRRLVTRSQSQWLPIAGQQSLPIGPRQFALRPQCSPEPLVEATVHVYGQPITARVTCTSPDIEPSVEITVPSSGINKIQFSLNQITRNTACSLLSTNEYSTEPLEFTTAFNDERTAASVSLRKEGSELENPTICCHVCGIGVVQVSHVWMRCTPPDGSRIWFDAPHRQFDYSFETLRGRRCERVLTDMAQSVTCECQVGEARAALTLEPSGHSQSVTILPPDEINITQPASGRNLTSTASGATDGPELGVWFTTTPARDVTAKMSMAEFQHRQNVHLINVMAKARVASYSLLTSTLQSLAQFVRGEPAAATAGGETLSVLANVSQIDWMGDEDEHGVFSIGADSAAANRVIGSMVELVETVAYFDASQSESEMMPSLLLLEDAIHNVIGLQQPGHVTELQTPNSHVKGIKLTGDGTTTRSLILDHIDQEGVTRYTRQGCEVPADVLGSLEAGSTVVVSLLDPEVISPPSKGQQHPAVTHTEDQVTTRAERRATDLLLVSAKDPDGQPLSVPSRFSLNFHDTSQPHAKHGVYDTWVRHLCAWYDLDSGYYMTSGVEAVEMEDSRGVCRASHSTPFAIIADVTQMKTRDNGKGVARLAAAIPGALAVAVLLCVFCTLLFLFPDLEDGGRRSLLTTGAMATAAATYILLLHRDGGRGWCVGVKAAFQLSGLLAVGGLASESLSLLHDVDTRLWRVKSFGLAHAVNAIAMPVGGTVVALVVNLLTPGTGTNCFNSLPRLEGVFLLSVMGAYLLATAVMLLVAYRAADRLVQQEQGFEIEPVLRTRIWNQIYLLPGFAGLAVLSVLAPGSGSTLLHVLFTCVMLVHALVTAMSYCLSSPDVERARAIRHQRQVQPKKKDKPTKPGRPSKSPEVREGPGAEKRKQKYLEDDRRQSVQTMSSSRTSNITAPTLDTNSDSDSTLSEVQLADTPRRQLSANQGSPRPRESDDELKNFINSLPVNKMPIQNPRGQ